MKTTQDMLQAQIVRLHDKIEALEHDKLALCELYLRLIGDDESDDELAPTANKGGRPRTFYVCQAADCDDKHAAKGLCIKHYARVRRVEQAKAAAKKRKKK